MALSAFSISSTNGRSS